MRGPDKQQNVPIRPRNNQQVQTDVKLIGSRRIEQIEQQIVQRDTQFLNFVNESWMLPFSDYFLLNQLNTVIQQLRNNQAIGDQYRTRRIIDQLSSKIHGLLARQLKVSSTNSGYYDVLLDKQRELTKLEIKYGNFEKKIGSYIERIHDLENQIRNLRGSLKMYQVAAQQNQLYKGFFRDIKDLTVSSKKQTDFERILNEQILPKIRQFEANLGQISKNTARERNNKLKASISKYALQLDTLSKTKELSSESLANSIASFYSAIDNQGDADWINDRIKLSENYNELKTRYTAVISLVSKNINQLLKKDAAFKNFQQVATLLEMLKNENRGQIETMIVNGWIGLGVIHCHRHQGGDAQQTIKLKSLIRTFQQQIARLTDKYPQLNDSISVGLRQFLNYQISNQFIGDDSLNWLRSILVKQTEVVHVDNVYNYYNKNDQTKIMQLRVLVKALVQQLKRIGEDPKVNIQLDQGILQLLKLQALDGVNIDDFIALFRPAARICQVGVLVNKPTYLTAKQTIGVPIKEQKAVVVADTAHFAVNLQQGVPYRKQIPYQYCKSQVVQIPVTIQRPYSIPTKVTQQVVRQVQKVSVVKVPVQQDRYVQVIRQVLVNAAQQVLVSQQIPKQFRVPYHTSQVQTREIQVQKQVPKNVYKQINKIFKVQQTVPKVYKQPKYEVVQKNIHHVVVQKQIQFVQVEKPIIERHQVAKICQVMVQKPIYYTEHCDCQKPQAIVVQVQKPVFKQFAKQVIVEKCHYVQGNVQQKIVEVACHTQVPIYKQIIRQQPVFIQKIVPFRTVQEKLVVVDRQIPFFIEHFTPVELIVEKPVIVRDIKHVQVRVETPIPVYIEKLVPKIVQVQVQKIVPQIVQVVHIVEIQKIVQKIVPVPRIIQKIVPQIQIVQVPVFIQTPIIEIVQVQVDKLVTNVVQVVKVVQVKQEVLKIQKNLQVIQKVEYQQVRKVIEVQPQNYPQIIVEKIVRVVQQHPVQVYIDRIVDRVIHIKDIVPVQQRVQIPIQVQCPVQIITPKPIFYQQPIHKIDIQRVQREKIVQIVCEVVQPKQILKPYIQKQKQIIQLPGQTIILKQPQLHIVQVQRQNIITATDVEERPVEHYMDLQKAHVIDQQTYVVPEKQVCYLQKPYAVSIQKPVGLRSQQMVVLQRPDTMVVKTRQGRNEQVLKIITQQKLAVQKQSYPEPIKVPQHHYHVLYEQLPPKGYDRSVLAVNQKVRTQQVQNVQQVMGAVREVTVPIQVPVYMQKIFEKILMLPQIVQVQKKVYMVEQINSLIAKQVNIDTHYDDYRAHMLSVQDAINQLLVLINTGKQGNTAQFKRRLTLLLQLLRTQSRIPKIVQRVRDVQVIKERDRPVLIPVYDQQRQKILYLIISDLIEGIKGLSKAEIDKRFSQRIRNIFYADLGFSSRIQGVVSQYGQGTDLVQIQGKWKSWLDNYDKHLPNTRPDGAVSQAQRQFMSGFNSKDYDYRTLRASLQRSTLINKQRLQQIGKLRVEYVAVIADLRVKIQSLEALLANEKYYKDLYLNELLKIRKMLQQSQYDQILSIIQTITSIRQDVLKSRGKTTKIRRDRDQAVQEKDLSQQKVSQLLSQLLNAQNETHLRDKQIQILTQENNRLRYEIDQIKLNIPVWNLQNKDDKFVKYNQQWEERIRGLQQNHFLQLNHLRQQLIKRLTDGSGTSGAGEEFARNYDELVKKYSALTQSQSNSQNTRRNLINSYEQKLRDANKELLVLRRDNQALQKKNQTDKNRLIDDYERRISSTSSAQQNQLRRQIQILKRDYENLQQRSQADRKKLIDDYEKRATTTASNQERQLRRQLDQSRRQAEQSRRQAEQSKRNLESAESRFQAEKKKLIEDYENKAKLNAGQQQKQLRRQLETIRKKLQGAQQKCDVEKKKIIDDYEKRLSTSASNQQRQLRRQLENLKKSYQGLENKSEEEKKKLIDDYENKLRSSGSSDRQLKNQLEIIKKNHEAYQKTAQSQKNKATEEYERRIKQLQDDLDRAKTSKRGAISSPQQNQQLQILKDKIKKLEIELDSSKKQIQNYQKSRLGQTTYTSGIKQSILESQFQSPQGASRYKSSGPKFEQVGQSSGGFSKQQEQPHYQRSSQVEKGRISKSGVRGEQQKLEQSEQRSSSSRVSGTSEVTRASMTIKQFIQKYKGEDKASITTNVMIKIIEKIQEQADKGMVNSYNTSNIYLSNFNPNNLDALIVRFGAPITNRKSASDGLYLSPQILRGEGTTLKSIVFTLAVIWDQIIHGSKYYSSVAEIENLSYEYKVRDTSLNPILRNTLFEMMAKDPAKRLELGQAKRRLSLQRYIVSQGRGGRRP